MNLTAQDILKHGFTGSSVGQILKNSKTWTDEHIEHFKNTGEKPVFEKKDLSVKEGSVFEWFLNNPCVNNLLGSSKTQKRTWLEEGAVTINGKKVGCDDLFPDNLTELVFFKGSKSQITMV